MLECAATTDQARNAIGGETFHMQGADRGANMARETALRTRAQLLQQQMNQRGAALGLSSEAIMAEFNAHKDTLRGPIGEGGRPAPADARMEHARALAERSDACDAAAPRPRT